MTSPYRRCRPVLPREGARSVIAMLAPSVAGSRLVGPGHDLARPEYVPGGHDGDEVVGPGPVHVRDDLRVRGRRGGEVEDDQGEVVVTDSRAVGGRARQDTVAGRPGVGEGPRVRPSLPAHGGLQVVGRDVVVL